MVHNCVLRGVFLNHRVAVNSKKNCSHHTSVLDFTHHDKSDYLLKSVKTVVYGTVAIVIWKNMTTVQSDCSESNSKVKCDSSSSHNEISGYNPI